MSCLSSGLFFSEFPTNNLYAFLFSPIRTAGNNNNKLLQVDMCAMGWQAMWVLLATLCSWFMFLAERWCVGSRLLSLHLWMLTRMDLTAV
jgi:hypothetical protein